MNGAATPESLRALPSISSLLERADVIELGKSVPRGLLVDAVRAAVARVRERGAQPDVDWPALIAAQLQSLELSSLLPVINATGVVLHTNLGRAPLAAAAIRALKEAATRYSTLEFDLGSGERGSRDVHCVALLQELTGAEDALVVNNCAAALVLALNTLAPGQEVLISRGELIEIGGSFRIPAIMERSSARLVEVGTTNRTHLLDYRASITERTAAIVKVHRSNFAQSGYVADVGLRELATLAAAHSLPVVFDLGSGLLLDLRPHGFPPEPTASQALTEGASLVLMSGDKLLGGPQAGIALGQRDVIARMRSNPLARAVRVDKLTIAALEATLRLYRDPEHALRTVPVLAMLTAPVERVRARAELLSGRLRRRGLNAEVVASQAAVGAGAFPSHEIPSAAVALDGDAPVLAARLRGGDPAVVGYVRDGRVLLDLRSVAESDDTALLEAIARSLPA